MKVCLVYFVLGCIATASIGCQTQTHPLDQPIGYSRLNGPGPTPRQLFDEGQSLASLVEEFNLGEAITNEDGRIGGYAKYLEVVYGHGPLTVQEVVTALRTKPADLFKEWDMYHDLDFVYGWIERTRRVPKNSRLVVVRYPNDSHKPYPYMISLEVIGGSLKVRDARFDKTVHR